MASQIPNTLIYQVGRHTLDGASVDWIADKTSLSVEEVTAAWQACLKRLAPVLGIATEDPVHIDRFVRDDPESSLRLLLQWHEFQVMEDHAATFSQAAQQSELFSDDEAE